MTKKIVGSPCYLFYNQEKLCDKFDILCTVIKLVVKLKMFTVFDSNIP